MDRYGNKTGGRRAGTPNKKTKELVELMGDYSPLEALLEIAQDSRTPLDVKVKVNLDLMNYIYPKRKSIETKEQLNFSIVNPDAFSKISNYLELENKDL